MMQTGKIIALWALAISLSLSIDSVVAAPPGADGVLRLQVVDSETGDPIPARIELKNARGRNAVPRGVGLARHGEHFYTPGSIELPLRKGGYTFIVDAGVEYRPQSGHFEIERHADDEKTVEMNRFADMAKEGWYMGDVDVSRTAKDLGTAMQAEGLHYVPLVAYRWEDGNWTRVEHSPPSEVTADEPRILERSVVEVSTPGGRLICVAPGPLTDPPAWPARDTLSTIVAAKAAGYYVLAASPTEWEFPAWLATGKLDGVVLFGQSDRDIEAGQRSPDRTLYRGDKGTHRWHEEIYFHALNAGIKLPPLGGSCTGPSDVALGTSRTYVACTATPNRKVWWKQAIAGANVISTGPLLRPRVGGDPPGQVYAASKQARVEFAIALNLATRTGIEYLEILKNGEIVHEVRLQDWAAAGGKLPPLAFDGSGWFAVRAVTNATDRYDLALTAPYYVQDQTGPRISREACGFFLDWLDELAKRAPDERTISDDHLATARKIWEGRLSKVTSE